MANSFKNNVVILDTFMAHFQNNTQFVLTANRNFTEDYKNKPMRKSDTLQYRLPYGFDVGDNLTITPQDIEDRTRSITVDKLANIALQFNGKEITLEDAMKDPFAKEYMLSQVEAIANKVEIDIGTSFYKSTYHTIGAPGSAVTASTIGDVRAAMGKLGILFGKLYGAIPHDVSNSLTNSVNNVFNSKVNSAAMEKGYLGSLKGFEFFETVHLPRHTSGIGASASSPVVQGKKSAGTVNGQVTSGSIISFDGLANSATVFKSGDIIEINGVYSVNPLTKASTGMKQQFVVTEDVTSNASGQANVKVSPEIVVSGKYQNISGPIPDDAQALMLDDHNVSIFYNKEAFYYAAPQLAPLKNGVTSGVSYDPKYRMALTWNKGSDIINYREIERIDHFYGKAFNGEFAFRVVS